MIATMDSLTSEPVVAPVERAVSLKPAWAWAVVYLDKGIENRTWWTTWRGPVLVHASSQVKQSEHDAHVEEIRRRVGRRSLEVPRREWLMENLAGRLLALARVVDCILPGGFAKDERGDPASMHERFLLHGRDCDQPVERISHILHERRKDRWYDADGGMYGYVLEDTRELEAHLPCPGKQGIWKVPPDVLKRVRVRR